MRRGPLDEVNAVLALSINRLPARKSNGSSEDGENGSNIPIGLLLNTSINCRCNMYYSLDDEFSHLKNFFIKRPCTNVFLYALRTHYATMVIV